MEDAARVFQMEFEIRFLSEGTYYSPRILIVYPTADYTSVRPLNTSLDIKHFFISIKI